MSKFTVSSKQVLKLLEVGVQLVALSVPCKPAARLASRASCAGVLHILVRPGECVHGTRAN